ncbi:MULTISPECIES: nitrogenase molybdenum-iron protein subunit beta [Marichromatium]|uniref:Nitrogenase molybdenum-iron protein beta chain n=1 Tax=Marichromatium gracile TaxID=1048 RepID=A0A4R4A7U5_MARGR|nr:MULTISPECIES: nitrogenase molybdenum-iron protein subunit beta [Marichromatium]MBO8085681.1 nitrogenase molybdenum-iron protein subunit beta [Marichromatium sp.]MBK1710389.1 nitrogenase molybdenum-iron protein subunit beta [Marichromatium gracile]RNE90638.1 nitrogenase molybdenum-iron protein subunit beta [Marichromatium sp. AB31]RNE92793.1 nitrogenase molybdenum-iron protein subunit beta [Marichromatium sp. AB32]TCW34559.1 Mo-nitrogenase MoFe protein subunit NifK [Marichromatium gracile]
MSQTVDNIKPCYPLFRDADYVESLANKRETVEEVASPEKIEETFAWTTTEEYQELNFKREALTINPAKACQPLGAVLCSLGFEKTLPYVHGSQGCVAYFRTYFNRHFKEPVACVSDSMTEDAAVFGGQKNMFDGLENARALYKPEMIAVSTTCMAEVIGDDLNAFIGNARKEGHVPEDFPVPFAHTPSFVGSHTTGWDNMFEGIQRYFTLNAMEDKVVGSNGKINLVPGFETYLGNYRVMHRMMQEMGVDYSLLCDPAEVLDTPADGEFRMYDGGTSIAEVKDAPNAVDTLLLQPWQLVKTKKFTQQTWKHDVPALNIPMGLAWTDDFLMKVSELTGKPIPESLTRERGRLVDMMTDSHTWLHGKKFALYGDADFVMGMTQFLMELGAEPTHILCSHANKRWKKAVEKLLAESPYGASGKVYVNHDLWHLRSLCFTDKPDFLIGNSYGKFIQRDTLHKGKDAEVPLIRIGFPIFDRHHLHRMTTMGYEGAMYILTTLVNAVLERLDEETREMGVTDFNYDLVR